MPRLDGKTVLITGASSGLGAAFTRACAREGADLLLVARSSTKLDSITSELIAGPASIESIPADVSDPDAVDALFKHLSDSGRHVDAAFLNAGDNLEWSSLQPGGRLGEISSATWRRALATNLDGFFFMLQGVARTMKSSGGGSIIATSSTSGLRSEPLVGYGYVAAKSAAIAVARQASLELARWKIRVNVIAPGPFATNIGAHREPSVERANTWLNTIPMRRRGDPREIEGLALLLASDESSFMTGGVFTIDGGAAALTQVGSEALWND